MSEILFKTHNTIETFNDNLGNKEDLAICEYNEEKLQRRIALENFTQMVLRRYSGRLVK